MYRRPKFLEILLEIRQEMAREADFDANLFVEMLRAGSFPDHKTDYQLVEDQDLPETRAKKQKSKTANHK